MTEAGTHEYTWYNENMARNGIENNRRHVLKKEERLLFLYDLFLQTKEPDYETIVNLIPYPNRRMFQRDMAELTECGLIKKVLNRHGETFYYEDGNGTEKHSVKRKRVEGKKTGNQSDGSYFRHMNRLQRLGLLMRELETSEEDISALRDYRDTLEYGDEEEKADARIPEVLSAKELYYQLVPDATERLRQRDFALLNKVGYKIWYDRLTDKYIASFPYSLAESYGLIYADGKIWSDPDKYDRWCRY